MVHLFHDAAGRTTLDRLQHAEGGMEQQVRSPNNAEHLLDELSSRHASLTPQLRRAAKYVLDHPSEVGVTSIRALAGMADVTPNTLVRLAKEFGFQGYSEFREPFRRSLRERHESIPDRARWLQSLGRGGSEAAIIGQMASELLGNVEHLYSTVAPADLKRAAELITQGRSSYVLGSRGSYSLAHNFYYVARMALSNLVLVPRQASTPLDDIIGIGSGDVLLAIALAPYARDTVQAARYAKEQGAAVVAVTDSRASPLVQGADVVFVAPSRSPQFFNSIVASAALLETLMAVIVAEGDEGMLASIRLYDRVREDSHAYWTEED